MDRALWLLLGLRFKSWLRRFGRGLRSVKGAVLTCAGLGVLILWIAPHVIMDRHSSPEHVEAVRRFGPMILFAYCLVTLLFSTGERAIYFNPAEVNFLFSGPFHRRQLLLYKVVASLGLCALSALVMTVVMRDHAVWTVAAYVGMFLSLMFIHLFSMVVALTTATVGELASSWRRRLVLAGLLVLAVAALWQIGRDALVLSNLELLARMQQSPAVQIVLSPFRWFLLAFTAERFWPDLVHWGSLALGVNLVLLLLALGLDAHYLETAASASARIYSRIEQMRRGGSAATLRGSSKARFELPTLPWWRGAGPIAWRQLTSAIRDFARLLLALFVFGMMAAPLLFSSRMMSERSEAYLIPECIIISMAVFLTQMLPFDFRADIDRVAELKVLPIASVALATGQVITPVLLMTTLQWATLLAIAAYVQRVPVMFWGVASFALPFNTLMFGIENALFLWFPTRLVSTNPGDIQAMGRVILLMLAKVLCLGLSAGAAALMGTLTYVLAGRSWAAAMAVAWLVLFGTAVALIPLVAHAFRQFDVSRDTPP